MRPGDIKGYYGEEVFIPQFKINKMNLSITPEKVKEAADKCPQAKETLKTLFPEVFKDKGVEIKAVGDETVLGDGSFNMVFVGKNLAPDGLCGKCLVLGKQYEWEFTKSGPYHILIPRTK